MTEPRASSSLGLTVGEGIPLAVKDLFDTAGLVTTYGSILFAEHVPTETAEAVRRLEAAGYVDVGKTNLHEFAYGTTSENPHFGTGAEPARARAASPAARAAAPRRRSRPGSPTPRSAPTPAARSGSPPRAAASSASSRPTGSCRSRAASRSRRASTTPGRWPRDVAGCARMMEALAPGLRAGGARARGRRGRRRLDSSTPTRWCASASRPPRRCSRAAAASSCRSPDTVDAAFMREVADVHRELFAEHADSYGENVRPKIERCLAVTDAEYEPRQPSSGSATASGAEAAAAASTWCSRRPSSASRRLRPPTSSRCATALIRLTSRSTPPAGRRSRCRAAPPRTACPPPCSSRLRPGEDAPVLAARREHSSGRCPSIDVTRSSEWAGLARADNFS